MVRAMAMQESHDSLEVPPDSIAARLTGAISLPAGKTPDDVRYEALCERFGIEPE